MYKKVCVLLIRIVTSNISSVGLRQWETGSMVELLDFTICISIWFVSLHCLWRGTLGGTLNHNTRGKSWNTAVPRRKFNELLPKLLEWIKQNTVPKWQNYRNTARKTPQYWKSQCAPPYAAHSMLIYIYNKSKYKNCQYG